MPDNEQPVRDGSQVIADRLVNTAMSKLGATYVWATAGPHTFDCSGFIWWIAGEVLGPQEYALRSSHHQFNVWGRRPQVTGSDSRNGLPGRGDLVFFNTMGIVVFGNLASHVGMMIDSERFIHAANEQLGVRIDALHGGWYAPRFIGSGRIGGIPAPSSGLSVKDDGPTAHGQEDSPGDHPPGSRSHRPNAEISLTVPPGPIRTPMPWNGQPPGVAWSAIGRWARELGAAANEMTIDVRLPAAVMVLETQGIHARDGAVLETWDHHPQDGPSVGVMQVKPWLWRALAPDANAWEPAGNIRLGVAVLAHLIDRYGSWERAIAEGYHPGVSPNGTTPARYVEAMRGLLGELGYAT